MMTAEKKQMDARTENKLYSAAEMAHHFFMAGESEKAIDVLRQAAAVLAEFDAK